MRYSYQLPHIEKYQLLTWASGFRHCMYIDAHKSDDPLYSDNSGFHFRLAVGCRNELKVQENYSFESLEDFLKEPANDWVFGGLSYDLKNELEDLSSNNKDKFNLPPMFFFVPLYLIEQTDEGLNLLSTDKILDLEAFVKDILTLGKEEPSLKNMDIFTDLSKADYIKKIEKVKEYIQAGDIYEMNFCQNFYTDNIDLSCIAIFERLNENSKAPFSTLVRNENFWLLSASPERYIHRRGKKVLSQPIKGTRKRGLTNEEDIQLRKDLEHSVKDKIENVMIVDLVRNDLSRYAAKSSVEVKELFGVYSFPHVHQMISTIACELKDDSDFLNIIKGSFPMGSMTGAPKIRAMELIEELESFKRSYYSGAFGYFNPKRDYDFNVVIRSVMYDSEQKYLSFPVGGAITISSSPEEEYEECMVKIQGILKALNASLVNVF